MEHIFHTKISQGVKNLQARISSCKENLQKHPGGGIIIPAR